MNPRDSKLTRLTDVKLHRLIRRGTTYGPPYDPNALSEADDEVARGAFFLFISAKAMATIEFLQQGMDQRRQLSLASVTSATRSSACRKKARPSPSKRSG
jgi:deferrochelatase/peroxidase EfeB